MPSDIIYYFETSADLPRVRKTDIETLRLGREAMLRNNRRDVAGNRSLPTREEEDKDDDGEMVVRRKGGKEVGGEDDAKSTFTSSTGQRSQLGATWRGSMDQTMNTGFGSSTRRTMNGRGVREGREREVRTSSMHGVGRTGKGPAAVPLGLSRAALGKLGAVTDEDEDGSDSDMSTTVEYQGRSVVDETTAEKRQRLRRDRKTTSSTVQVSQPKTKKSVKFADKDGTTINGNEIRRKKTMEKKEEGSWMSSWRPKLTWFV